MDRILQGMDHVMVFSDDILITAETEHFSLLDQVLTRLDQAGGRVNLSKCSFAETSVTYLGHRLDAEGIHPTTDKLKAIPEAQQPQNVT